MSFGDIEGLLEFSVIRIAAMKITQALRVSLSRFASLPGLTTLSEDSSEGEGREGQIGGDMWRQSGQTSHAHSHTCFSFVSLFTAVSNSTCFCLSDFCRSR